MEESTGPFPHLSIGGRVDTLFVVNTEEWNCRVRLAADHPVSQPPGSAPHRLSSHSLVGVRRYLCGF